MTRLQIQQTTPPREILNTPRATTRSAYVPFAGGIDGSFAPAFEVREYDEHFVLLADLPGVNIGDISIFIDHDWVTVCGRRGEETTTAGYRAYERTFGSFWRAFQLRPGITASGSRAVLERGVLRVHIPKRNAPS